MGQFGTWSSRPDRDDITDLDPIANTTTFKRVSPTTRFSTRRQPAQINEGKA